MANESSIPRRMWHRVGPLTLMWVLLFWTLAIVNHTGGGTFEFGLLVLMTALQLSERMLPSHVFSRFKFFGILLRLLLCYLLIGFTGGIESTYYILLLWPIVSAAPVLRSVGTLLVTLLSVSSYLSFLLFVRWPYQHLGPQGAQYLIIRSLVLMIMGCTMMATLRARDQSHSTT